MGNEGEETALADLSVYKTKDFIMKNGSIMQPKGKKRKDT